MSTTPAGLLSQMAVLQREILRLRDRETRRKSERRKLRIERVLDRAHLDALALITVHIGGGNVGRQYACLPQRRWAYAVALLRLAGLTGSGRDLRIEMDGDTDVCAKLDQATELAKRQPTQYASYLPAFNLPQMLRHDSRKK